jgi:anti-sigma regulatory factor (Ser/Thr protein kinase)
MVLLNPQEIVNSVLVTSGLESMLPVAHDLNEAVQLLGGISEASDVASSSTPRSTDASRPQQPAPSSAPSITEGELKLSIKNELSELESVNERLAEFLETHGVTGRAAYAVNLAIDELVVNVMHYAYVDDEIHMIDIGLVIDAEQIILRIEDDGRPFDPRCGPSLDLHAEEREVGGLGLLLVLDMVDVLKYRRVEERNWVEVRVHLASQLEQGDPSTGEQSNVSEAD